MSRLQQRYGKYFDADLTVTVIRNQQGQATHLFWLLRNIGERQQTELLTDNYIDIIQNRLQYLLQLLKQEVGEQVDNGTRLSVRFTHEELASACCTTRVTITRLLSKLQQQNLICFDAKKHIILKH